MHIVLPATLATAAACAFLSIWLAWRVGQVRRSEKVSIGDGGSMAVLARMRAHANFVEFAPFVLVLMALIELAKGNSVWMWVYGLVFVVARICHGLGMDSWKPGRTIGISLTLLVLAGLGIEGAVTAYRTAPPAVIAPVEVVPAG